ncbi:Endonuclease/exonuclease/phosphatase [Trema orientale]|uniref:Endonuclease/exonuclease/phosphatase n=1 Tax=Trema orientale TaxID=63057 RepID=A0A2P5FG35_TREOI|nr:Endonuclease/exonuclease/phosphatase [Trema orientale]
MPPLSCPLMKVLAWNCRGLARSAAVQSLRAMIASSSLSETIIGEIDICKRLRLIHFYHHVFVPPNTLSDGFCVVWKNGVDFEPYFVSKDTIYGMVLSDPPNCAWSLIAAYGPPAARNEGSFGHHFHPYWIDA